MSIRDRASLYTSQEHSVAARAALDETDIVAAINYIEGEVVSLDQLGIDDSVVAETLSAITTPHLEEVKRTRIHEDARRLQARQTNFVTKWHKNLSGPAEEQVRLFMNVAMDYEDPVCAQAALPYINCVATTRMSYAVLHNVMSRIAGLEQS
jgi:hypothetical protein